MTPLVALVLAVLVLAGLLALALGRRERGAGVHVAGRVPDDARDTLGREVRSLTDALADTHPPGPPDADQAATASSATAGTDLVPGPVPGPGRVPDLAPATDQPSAPAAPPAPSAWDPPGTHARTPGPPGLAAAYAALSARLLDEARCTESALARWAADLHLLAPVLADHEGDVVRALGPDALPDRRSAARVPVATDAVGRARYRVGTVVPPARRATAPVLPRLPDRTSLPAHPVPPAPVVHEAPEVLRERARVHTTRARTLVDADPVTARQAAWEADLAAFDAVLLEAARRGGDDNLVSVRLRRQLALHLLADERDPDALAATAADDVAPAVHRVRELLLACLEPHERGALGAALGSWSQDPGTRDPGTRDPGTPGSDPS